MRGCCSGRTASLQFHQRLLQCNDLPLVLPRAQQQPSGERADDGTERPIGPGGADHAADHDRDETQHGPLSLL